MTRIAQLQSLSESLRHATATRSPVRIHGAATWLHAGRPVEPDATPFDMRALAGVVEYVPGDLVITVHGGTSLAEIAEVTAAEGQWLALDPYVSAHGLTQATIGATVATASSGPLALGYGRVRDLALGVTFVSGDGTVVRGGGRVVKNVAGFDLVRLATGAWGTLGAITEVSLRLHARPAVDETIAVSVDLPSSPDARTAAMTQLSERLNGAPLLAVTNSLGALVLLTHHAVSAVNETHALPAALQQSPCLLLARVLGNRTRVDAMRAALGALGDTQIVDSAIWRAVRTTDTGNVSLRLSDAPLRTGTTWQHADVWLDAQAIRDARVIVEPLQGAIRLSGTLSADSSTNTGSLTLPPRTLIERLPTSAWSTVPVPARDHIAEHLRATFDPAGILNPGILDIGIPGMTHPVPA